MLDLTVPFHQETISLEAPGLVSWRTWIADYQPQEFDSRGNRYFSDTAGHAEEFVFSNIGDAEAFLRRCEFDMDADVWQMNTPDA